MKTTTNGQRKRARPETGTARIAVGNEYVQLALELHGARKISDATRRAIMKRLWEAYHVEISDVLQAAGIAEGDLRLL